jgi:processive 1,2-diacylglycerol beta-glucosyltransferase
MRFISRALILSGSVGKGHDSVAEAALASLATRGVDGEVLDCMRLLGGPGSRAGTALFRWLLSVPSLYDGFHFSHLRTGTRLPSALERAASRRLVPALRGRLAAGGFDCALGVFPTGVTAAARLKAEGADMAVVAVCTDACAHRMWVHQGVDLYVVCSALAANTVRRYDPAARIAVVPPPVRPEFFHALDRQSARVALGIPAAERCVLLMSGGWGLGPLAETAASLAGAGYQVLAVAGMNRRQQRRLEEAAARDRRVHPFGFTDRVPDLMSAADVVVTTPGQTCHEARVVGRWLVMLDIVPGHGRENALHEIEQGGALACSPDPASVLGAVQLMFDERPEIAPWPVDGTAGWDKELFGALESADLGPRG